MITQRDSGWSGWPRTFGLQGYEPTWDKALRGNPFDGGGQRRALRRFAAAHAPA